MLSRAKHCTAAFKHSSPRSSQQTREVAASLTVTLVLQLRSLEHREVKQFAEGHTARRGEQGFKLRLSTCVLTFTLQSPNTSRKPHEVNTTDLGSALPRARAAETEANLCGALRATNQGLSKVIPVPAAHRVAGLIQPRGVLLTEQRASSVTEENGLTQEHLLVPSGRPLSTGSCLGLGVRLG